MNIMKHCEQAFGEAVGSAHAWGIQLLEADQRFLVMSVIFIQLNLLAIEWVIM